MIPRGIAILALAFIGMLVAPVGSAVSAHAEYRSSTPANGATIATPPAQVVITFSQETSATQSNGSVTDTKGTVVSTGWSVDLNDRTKLTIPLKPNLPASIYTVNYTSQSMDTHVVTGSFIFTVDPAAAQTNTGAPWGLWLVVFSVSTILVAVLLVAVRSRTRVRTAGPEPVVAGGDERTESTD